MVNLVEVFKALAEESRLRILSLLLQDEMCVCEIEECLSMTQSNVSRHLNVLKKCGILNSYKKAQWVYYKIENNFFEENHDLFVYLTKELKRLPNYEKDCKNGINVKLQNLCDLKTQ